MKFKNQLITLVLAGIAASLLSACVATVGPGGGWVPGHYDRYGVWIPGHYTQYSGPRGGVWIPGHWNRFGGWVPGHWR